jgi:aminopeptidase
MNSTTVFTTAACCLAAIAGIWAPTAAHAAEKPDYKAIAERMVGQSAHVKEGDRVVVNGDIRDIDLIEEVTLAVWKRGAEPIQLVSREKAARRYFDEVPSKYDALPLAFALKLAEVQTVEIDIGGPEFPALLSDVAAERMNSTGNRMSDVWTAQRKHGVRSVWLGNFLYPTDAVAKQYGITKEQLSDIFWAGVSVDYIQLHATAEAMRAKLAAGREVRITHPNGTDLKLTIAGRPSFVNDGVISMEALAKGSPANWANLPAGEVYLSPVPGSAEGKIVSDAVFPLETESVTGATFMVKGGKLVSHSAPPSAAYTRWKALYDAAPEGKDQFAALDIGINPNVKLPPGGKNAFGMAAGTVSLGFGGSAWAGGSTDMMWNGGGVLIGSTVTVDGKAIVDKGVLVVQ